MTVAPAAAPVRIAVLGTSAIARSFVEAAGHVPQIAPTVVLSRAQETADAFAAEAASLGTTMAARCDRLAVLADPEVDAVYIASPTTCHEADVLEALDAGKHVLCEKPLALSLASFDRMHDRAREQGLVLMEAARAVHDPAWALIAEALPDLGRIWHARFEMCQYSSRYDAVRAGEHRRAFDPAFGHSALSDIGIYTVLPAVQLFGAPERSVSTSQRLESGFDASGAVLLTYPTLSVLCRYSKVNATTTGSTIEGEDATLRIDSVSEPGRIEIERRDGTRETLLDQAPRSVAQSMVHELADFARVVADGAVEHPFARISRDAVAVMERAYSEGTAAS